MTTQPYEAQVCRLMVSTPVTHVITWLLLIYWPQRMEGWVGLVGRPIADTLSTTIDQVKSTSQRPTS